LPEIKKITKGKLIHIFGSAGQRDKYKRPEMGKISSNFSDIIILTAEDPRSESVEEITSEIEKGIISKFNKKLLLKIPDRKKAIFKGIELAGKGDTVLITGKGHESSMNYGKGEEPWSEHEAVKEALKAKGITL
jgi:UDP-N-acetylmuramoyl-L-alanyl-D-glutamate--2,6-diaminopimelate ligase